MDAKLIRGGSGKRIGCEAARYLRCYHTPLFLLYYPQISQISQIGRAEAINRLLQTEWRWWVFLFSRMEGIANVFRVRGTFVDGENLVR
jgi:hypothetical protein